MSTCSKTPVLLDFALREALANTLFSKATCVPGSIWSLLVSWEVFLDQVLALLRNRMKRRIEEKRAKLDTQALIALYLGS